MLDFTLHTPESAGIPSDCISNFIMRLKWQQIPMHSFLLMHKDVLIAEGYYAPYQADTKHRMFSISKSLTSVAIGLLADEGKLSLDDPIIQYFPDKTPVEIHPWIAQMTIRDMLMMRTCHASTTYKLDPKRDWVESFFTTPPTHPAGRIFHYDTSSAHTLAALVERLSGMALLDYLKYKLAPLELSNDSYMLTDPFGVSMGGSGLVATPMDLLKFGWFIAHDGIVDGHQLLSANYIHDATSFLSDTHITGPVRSESCGYGYQFWRNEKGGWVSYGMGGQLIIYLPDQKLLCITTADTQGIGSGNQYIYDALYEEILPFVQENPLPSDEKAHTALIQLLSSLQIEPLCGSLSSPVINHLPKSGYRFASNSLGFSEMVFDFTKDEGQITFTLHGKKCSISFGFGRMVHGIFPGYDQQYIASGIWVREDTLYVKAHIIDEFVGSVHFEFSFGENDVTVFLRKQEESLFQEYNGHLYGTLK